MCSTAPATLMAAVGTLIVTPDAPGTHGAQLSIAFERDARARHAELGRRGIVCDFREPNIVRLAPVPLYNGYADARAAAAALCGHSIVSGVSPHHFLRTLPPAAPPRNSGSA